MWKQTYHLKQSWQTQILNMMKHGKYNIRLSLDLQENIGRAETLLKPPEIGSNQNQTNRLICIFFYFSASYISGSFWTNTSTLRSKYIQWKPWRDHSGSRLLGPLRPKTSNFRVFRWAGYQNITRPMDRGQTHINPTASRPGAAKNTIWAKMWNFEWQNTHISIV